MKNSLVTFLFCLASTIANAETFQVTRAIPCDKANKVLSIIPNYGENPVWQGKNTKNLFVLLTLNASTESWSLILTDGEFACLLENGQGFILQNKPTQPPQSTPPADKQIYKNL